MPKDDNPRNFAVMTVAEVAELLGVESRTVRNWINDKGLPATNDGRGRVLDWFKALAWFVQYRIDENGGNGGNRKPAGDPEVPLENYDQALARKTRAEADLKELQLARERAEVAAIADVEKVLAAANKSTQTLILAFPSRLATQLVGLDDRAKIYQLLQRECNSLLGNLASIDAVLDAKAPGAEAPEE